MEILLWLAPAGAVLLVTAGWAAWAGRRGRRDETDRSDAAQERFARAIAREHPGAARPRPGVVRDRSTGIAVRPSREAGRGGGSRPATRRSA